MLAVRHFNVSHPLVLVLKTKRGCGAGMHCMLPRAGPGGNQTKGIPDIEH